MLLSLLTTGMHQACPGSKVIWYDSVTVAGELRWQNALNQLNQYVLREIFVSWDRAISCHTVQ